MLYTGLYRTHLRPASEALVSTFLAMVAAPEQPMQTYYATLCAGSNAVLRRATQDLNDVWGNGPAPVPPALFDEEEDVDDD